jgi:hypothetical protein
MCLPYSRGVRIAGWLAAACAGCRPGAASAAVGAGSVDRTHARGFGLFMHHRMGVRCYDRSSVTVCRARFSCCSPAANATKATAPGNAAARAGVEKREAAAPAGEALRSGGARSSMTVMRAPGRRLQRWRGGGGPLARRGAAADAGTPCQCAGRCPCGALPLACRPFWCGLRWGSGGWRTLWFAFGHL